jgi:hypothetical protein
MVLIYFQGILIQQFNQWLDCGIQALTRIPMNETQTQ